MVTDVPKGGCGGMASRLLVRASGWTGQRSMGEAASWGAGGGGGEGGCGESKAAGGRASGVGGAKKQPGPGRRLILGHLWSLG